MAIKRILIANRGEIAVRVIRACHDLGITPIAVYSEADRGALHVRMAAEAYFIGPAPAIESYLSIEKILDVAKKSKADAIHPGYGFLSENAGFAKAVEDAGLKLIGPSAYSMELMGSKTSARQAASAVGAPIVPGTSEPLPDADTALKIAEGIGYPVMLKARAGGGGKGMRQVDSAAGLSSALQTAQAEAAAAFGDSAVYLEKVIVNPRHIEIQLLGDQHGNYVYLGERECSIQRRHQKVIEECPSPLNDADLRRRMGEAAVNVARAAKYSNAGTIEFLVDAEKNFYFLEMNTRLQVEHPVTELVTGIDLVKEQIRIANGEELGYGQEQIQLRGHAVECRIYAEDPDTNFMPAPGKVNCLREPSGPGIRVDSGIYEGWEVPIYYDPMIAKLVAYGSDRNEAISRLSRALDEYRVVGIKTTLPFFKEIIKDKAFLAGRLDTGFIERWSKSDSRSEAKRIPSQDELDVAAVAAALSYVNSQAPQQTQQTSNESKWKQNGRQVAVNSRLA
jgi:acetyl-CoA carboxylase biotin carboxylase subunit